MSSQIPTATPGREPGHEGEGCPSLQAAPVTTKHDRRRAEDHEGGQDRRVLDADQERQEGIDISPVPKPNMPWKSVATTSTATSTVRASPRTRQERLARLG